MSGIRSKNVFEVWNTIQEFTVFIDNKINIFLKIKRIFKLYSKSIRM